MKTRIVRDTSIKRSARSMQVESIFDVAPSSTSHLEWNVDIPIEARDWNVGLIVGPSGCGKSTIVKDLWGENLVTGFSWPKGAPIIDGFPKEMGAKEITALLSSVGFSSPPAWMRPFHVLSNGEQFRVTMARALAELSDLVVIDEFTSVVDRTVAQIGSAAIAKTVRKRGSKLIAATCHYDVEEWLDPDWVYLPAEQRFAWRSLQGRPKIKLEIRRIHHEAWSTFKGYHYLTADLNRSAVCFGAFIGDRIVAFHSYVPFVGRLAHGKAFRGHRSVCLPDFQGVGIGHALITHCASIVAGWGYRVFRNSGHPAEIAAAARDANWILIRPPSRTARDSKSGLKHATGRMTASFEYRGAVLTGKEAAQFRDYDPA